MMMSLPNSDQIRSAFAPENLLGKGTVCSVYKIPSHPDLVFRHVTNSFADKAEDFALCPIVSLRECEIDNNLNYGQPVAKVGGKDTINLKVPGEAIAHVLNHNDTCAHQGPENYRRKIFTLSRLPKESYEQLCADVIYLKRRGMSIDFTEGNVFLDEANKKFYLVDVHPYWTADQEYTDSGLSGLAAACILAHKRSLIEKLDPLEKQSVKIATKTILSKISAAGLKEGLSFDTGEEAKRNVFDLSKTMDLLDFSKEEKDGVFNTLLFGNYIFRNVMLGYLKAREGR